MFHPKHLAHPCLNLNVGQPESSLWLCSPVIGTPGGWRLSCLGLRDGHSACPPEDPLLSRPPPLPPGHWSQTGSWASACPSNSKEEVQPGWFLTSGAFWIHLPFHVFLTCSPSLLVCEQSISSRNSVKTGGCVCKTNLWKTNVRCGICSRGTGALSSTSSLEPPL